jgi:hypothetical protein
MGAIVKGFLRKICRNWRMLGIDPVGIVRRFWGLSYFFRNLWRYRSMQKGSAFLLSVKDLYYTSFSRFRPAGTTRGHYFWQDLWAARYLFDSGARNHVDVGSRIDGFVAHILPFCRVTYVDYRPVEQRIPNLSSVRASVLDLPFPSHSLRSLSCLHVIEHIGLGRYGDPVDPFAYKRAAGELTRVLHDYGVLLIGVPVGQDRLCFDAHRVFDPKTVEHIFAPLTVEAFSLIDDYGQFIEDAHFAAARQCDFGCGLFVFKRANG